MAKRLHAVDRGPSSMGTALSFMPGLESGTHIDGVGEDPASPLEKVPAVGLHSIDSVLSDRVA